MICIIIDISTRVVWTFSDLAYVKLRTSGLGIGNQTGAGGTATLRIWKLFWSQPMAPWALGAAYQQSEKVQGLAYNQCETRDKWPLGKDPNRSWCHTRMLRPMSMEPWGCDQKSFKLTYLTTSSPAPSVIPSMWTRLKIVCPLEWMTTGPAPTFSTTYPFQSQSTPDLINSLFISVGMYVYSITCP